MKDRFLVEDLYSRFLVSFSELSQHFYQNTLDKGFRKPGVQRNQGEEIALIHSELSEALEGIRHGNPPDDKIPEFSAAEAEMADACIRIMETCFARGWRLGQAIIAKHEFNKTRPYKHGKKF